jgi:hypothetical protein
VSDNADQAAHYHILELLASYLTLQLACYNAKIKIKVKAISVTGSGGP